MVHVFILMGQSNMAGRGYIGDVPPISDSRIKVLKNGRWQCMWEPIHTDRRFAGIGLAASFAEEWLKDHPDEEIGLVACAEGGSSLTEWMPGQPLFEHAVAEAGFAAKLGVIDGILWHQGETDTTEEALPAYLDMLHVVRWEFVKRTGLGKVPFILGELGEFLPQCPMFPELVNYEQINHKLMLYENTHTHTCLVTARGLTSNPDMLHFDAVSQRLFGMRYYAAYKTGKNVMQPLKEEAEIRKALEHYRDASGEEKKNILTQMSQDGRLDKVSYSYAIADL